MHPKTPITGLIALIMAFASPLAFADNSPQEQPPMHHAEGGWHHGDKDEMMSKVLNLSDDQVKQIKDLREKQKDSMKSTFEQIKANRQALDAEISKAAPDMNKVNDLQAQLKAVQAQMVDAHLNSILEIKKIMTPEQFAGYMALHKEREMKMHKGGHKHWMGKDKDSDKHEGDKDQDND